MAKIVLECREARYDSEMRIWCRPMGTLCKHQRWCLGKGRAVMTDMAPDCSICKRAEAEKTEGESTGEE